MKEKKRILFLLASVAGGGAERVSLTLLSKLPRSTFDLHLALITASGAYLSEIPGDIAVHDLGCKHLRSAILRIIRLVWCLRPQVVFSTLSHVSIVLLVFRRFLPRGTRIIIREAITISSHLKGDCGRSAELWGFLFRRYYKTADKVICQSDHMLLDLEEHFNVPYELMKRIYNPVDTVKISQRAKSVENPFFRKAGGPQLVAAGRLCHQKGFDLLLEALVQVRERYADVHLTILGEGLLEDPLRQQAEALDLESSVTFAGFQTNPYCYFSHADLFVLSSRYEGLPNAMLEALCLGAPVVAIDCPGGVKEIMPPVPWGWLTNEISSTALARAILTALSSPRKPPLPAGWDAKFDITTVMEEYASVFAGSP